jgi:hypothetical protein
MELWSLTVETGTQYIFIVLDLTKEKLKASALHIDECRRGQVQTPCGVI